MNYKLNELKIRSYTSFTNYPIVNYRRILMNDFDKDIDPKPTA